MAGGAGSVAGGAGSVAGGVGSVTGGAGSVVGGDVGMGSGLLVGAVLASVGVVVVGSSVVSVVEVVVGSIVVVIEEDGEVLLVIFLLSPESVSGNVKNMRTVRIVSTMALVLPLMNLCKKACHTLIGMMIRAITAAAKPAKLGNVPKAIIARKPNRIHKAKFPIFFIVYPPLCSYLLSQRNISLKPKVVLWYILLLIDRDGFLRSPIPFLP